MPPPDLLSWYVVINSERLILAVYGQALKHIAVDMARTLLKEQGPVSLHHYTGQRPSVGGLLSPGRRTRETAF